LIGALKHQLRRRLVVLALQLLEDHLLLVQRMAAELTQSPTAFPFPMAAGGTRTTSGRPFSFGASTAAESTTSQEIKD